MPWKELCAMDQRLQLIQNWLTQDYTITELGELYGVSRKTVYKWLVRYRQTGISGLEELTRAPLHHPNATPLPIVKMLIQAKLSHPHWGPKKLLARLKREHSDIVWPVVSTVGELLDRHGLVKHRHPRHHTPPYSRPFQYCSQPNAIWSTDYKGHFRMGNGHLCHPLTLSDNYSRYILGCWALERMTYEHTQPLLERALREYGLPVAIRTDNGSPFASVGVGGLSKLAIWLIKLGIIPERIEVGKPQQNGRHERMHRTLKAEAIAPPRVNLVQQQRAFDRFVREFNHDRPHEAIGQQTPDSVYQPSVREYPTRLPAVEYPAGMLVRHLHSKGCMKWNGDLIYVSEALRGEAVGLRQVSEHEWEMRFSFHYLGTFNELTHKIRS